VIACPVHHAIDGSTDEADNVNGNVALHLHVRGQEFRSPAAEAPSVNHIAAPYGYVKWPVLLHDGGEIVPYLMPDDGAFLLTFVDWRGIETGAAEAD
jgi:hypothetical protein